MNEHFVNIKVDREERPDVDAVYMEATQAMTGQGGWPMTVLLTPAGEPFFCGTYFPPRDGRGMPSFRRVLESVAEAWESRREEIEQSGADVVDRALPAGTGSVAGARDHRRAAGRCGSRAVGPSRRQLGRVRRRTEVPAVDDAGVPAAPSRPHRRRPQPADGRPRRANGWLAAACTTSWLVASPATPWTTHWVVPHFEKMLYDNALLARVYAHWWRATGSPLARRIAVETCDWMLRDLLTTERRVRVLAGRRQRGRGGSLLRLDPAVRSAPTRPRCST